MNNHPIPLQCSFIQKKKRKKKLAKYQDVIEVLKDQIVLFYITKSHHNANYNYSNSTN